MQQSQYTLQNKRFFRSLGKETRKILIREKRLDIVSDEIVNNIKKLPTFKDAKNILLFYPKEGEIDLAPLFKSDKNFFLPRCSGKNLEICPFKNENELMVGQYGIKEPTTEKIQDLSLLDLVFIPALCADKNFNRLGYGGGYYDRFLSDKTLKAVKITVIPDELLYENIPSEITDIKSDMIITQSSVIKR